MRSVGQTFRAECEISRASSAAHDKISSYYRFVLKVATQLHEDGGIQSPGTAESSHFCPSSLEVEAFQFFGYDSFLVKYIDGLVYFVCFNSSLTTKY